MANPEHLNRLKLSIANWNMWRNENPTVQPALSYADLRGINLNLATLQGADLRGADLQEVTLRHADLRRADLRLAKLTRADLRNASLRRATMRSASLSGTVFYNADLSYTNFQDADLRNAVFDGATLREANFGGAYMHGTAFGDQDLRVVKGLESVRHIGPSPLSINTIYRSQGDIPEAFLRGAGLPDTFIEYARSLVSYPIEYYTCFISYSSQDETFARRLYADLQQSGVRCWFAPHSLRPGDLILSRIDEAIRLYDKLVLILSQQSVQSRWVEVEVTTAQTKEVYQGCQMLFPLRLDEMVMNTTTAWARSLREQRHIADFTGWKDHDIYQEAFTRLLKDLQAETKPLKS